MRVPTNERQVIFYHQVHVFRFGRTFPRQYGPRINLAVPETTNYDRLLLRTRATFVRKV